MVPGELGVQVFENGDRMPVTAERAMPLPPVRTWSYPAAADVAGWQPVLTALAGGGPATGAVSAGSVYAGYAPAGSFALSVDGRAAPQRPAFGWAAQYQAARGQASLSLSQFPYVPLTVTLELATWVAVAVAILGRPRRPRRAGRAAGSARGPS